MTGKRTSSKKKARELAKYLRGERPDYAYLKSLFQHLRTELEIQVPKASKKLPYVPTEEELKRYYEVVWKSKNFQDMMIVKTLMYTGIRVSELINIRLVDIDFHYCQVRINNGKGGKDRIVPFPQSFKELLAMHAEEEVHGPGNTKDFVQTFGGSWPCSKLVATQAATFPADLAQKAGHR